MLKTKDVSMTKLFQQKLFDKLAKNSGTAEAALVVNRTFSFCKGTCVVSLPTLPSTSALSQWLLT